MGSAVYSVVMSESMTPQAAARVLQDAAAFEESLRQRTEGITAMVWGAVGPGVYLTYAYAELVAGFPEWAFALLWMPWIFAGSLVTFTIWHTASLSWTTIRDPITPGGYLLRFVLLVGALIVGFSLFQPDHYGVPLVFIGVFYLVMGGLNVFRMSSRGRAGAMIAGTGLVAAGALALLLPESGLAFTGVVLAAGLFPLVTGLWQALTG